MDPKVTRLRLDAFDAVKNALRQAPKRAKAWVTPLTTAKPRSTGFARRHAAPNEIARH